MQATIDYSTAKMTWIKLDELAEVVLLRHSEPPAWDEGWGQATITTAYRYANSMADEGWQIKHS